jgi:hypothetical protein
MTLNEHETQLALTVEEQVLQAHREDLEFLKTGEAFRYRLELWGEFPGCKDREGPSNVLAMLCLTRGVCRWRVSCHEDGDDIRDEQRQALPADATWFDQHLGEQYRVRRSMSFEGPHPRPSDRKILVVVERDPHVLPGFVELAGSQSALAQEESDGV